MFTWLPDALCLLLCAVAAVGDVRRYEIPNWIPALGILAALVLCPLPAALLGGGFLLVLAGLLGALHLLGMGDVKLLVATGALLRWPLAALLPLHVALAGGVVAVVMLIARPSSKRIPYGVAIALGVAWAIASRHVPALRLL